jgi:hypothetical protein
MKIDELANSIEGKIVGNDDFFQARSSLDDLLY